MAKTNSIIALSDLVWESVCTYWWPLRSVFDDAWQYLEEDLNEIKTKENKVNVEGKGLVSMNDIDIDYEVDDEVYDYFEECFKDEVENDELINALAKYWLTYKWLSFYKHKWAYNFAWDTLDMEFEYDDDIDWKEKYPELIEEVQYYIDNVRKKSCDWYISFEPTKVDEVYMWQTTYVWAVLHKEWLLDDIKKNVEGWVYEILTDHPWEYDNSKIVLRGDDWHIDWDTKYYVDIQDKILREIKN